MLQINKFRSFNLTFCVFKVVYTRNVGVSAALFQHKKNILYTETDVETGLDKLIEQYESKLLYNTLIESKYLKLGYRKNSALLNKLSRTENNLKAKLGEENPLPLSLKYVYDDIDYADTSTKQEAASHDEKLHEPKVTHFPFEANATSVASSDNVEDVEQEENIAKKAKEEVMYRNELNEDLQNWMTAYDNYEDNPEDIGNAIIEDSSINYGTPDPSSKVSHVPCGGCGALLHCKDKSIPGYIPSEIFKNFNAKGGTNLQAIICQRCYFLKNHNLALQVRVTPEDYPKVLETISHKRALIILMVDLLDFPCSIWPGIGDIFGRKNPIVVVGNKVDLLPQDGRGYLDRIKKMLLSTVKESGFTTFNVKHVALISAKTGYGIEELITHLQSIWKHQGDVYLVGCTNVGKSSLFNFLLQSDYCKSQATDLIQRATTSIWPGTTLNLLKFPIMRPSGYRLFLRHQRLKQAAKAYTMENKLRKEQLRLSRDPQYATLIGHVDRTYPTKNYVNFEKDAFQVVCNSNASGRLKLGINENDPDYAMSRWCFDTPGVVQPDQIIHLLTTDELIMTLPKELIRPRTFCIKPGTSLLIGGLARLDYTEGLTSIRVTVFCSNELPITLCHLEKADALYNELLGTALLKVPTQDSDRLSRWPGLSLAKSFTLTGKDYNFSCNDVVLSNAGWVAVSGGHQKQYKLQAWTPEKRGVYIRDCLLPFAVTLRGARIRNSPAYKINKLYLN